MLEILYDNGPCLVVNKPAGMLTQAPAGIDSLEVQVKAFYREREAEGGQHLPGPAPSARSARFRGDRVRPARPRGPAALDAVRESHGHESLLGGGRRRCSAATKAPGPTTCTSGTAWPQSIVVPADDPARQAGRHAIPRARRGIRTTSGTRGSKCELETGRTHQIRVQAASRGHAVVGDAQYGATQPFGEQFEDERCGQSRSTPGNSASITR